MAAALGRVGVAGGEAQRVVAGLRTALQAAAAQSVKTVRSLAKFDEINRLAAPAAQTQKNETAAKAAKRSAARAAGRGSAQSMAAVWKEVLAELRSVWADFWAYLQGFFAPFANTWSTLCGAVLAVWQPLWAQVLAVVQPVLAQLQAWLGALWAEHLQPLWSELTACLGAVGTLLLTVWNTVLAPFLQWLAATLGPVAAGVFTALGTAVTGAVGIIADGITIALAVLHGLADFLTAVLRGEWDAAWQAMAGTVATVWGRIVSIVQTAVSTVLGVVHSMVSALGAALQGLLDGLGRVGSLAAGALQGAGRLLTQSALPGLEYAAGVQVPALAQGAVLPPNRQFLAVLGDQTSGTNVEAPLATIKQAMAEVLSGWNGAGDGQPINVYIGEELLDSVIANSQSRRALRSGR